MSLVTFTQLLSPIIGFIIGVFFGAAYGRNELSTLLIGGGLGGIAGSFMGLAAHFLFWGGLFVLVQLVEWWRPSYPTCRQGRCGPDGYTPLLPSESEKHAEADRELALRMVLDDIGLLVRCRCGDRYVSSRKQRQLLEVGPEGTLRPYRYHRPFGRKWLPAR